MLWSLLQWNLHYHHRKWPDPTMALYVIHIHMQISFSSPFPLFSVLIILETIKYRKQPWNITCKERILTMTTDIIFIGTDYKLFSLNFGAITVPEYYICTLSVIDSRYQYHHYPLGFEWKSCSYFYLLFEIKSGRCIKLKYIETFWQPMINYNSNVVKALIWFSLQR